MGIKKIAALYLIDANLPFGGMKQSGTGRDFGPDWLDGWCETKSVCVRY
nr:aldehyde dehydrogenase family protein [Escherichia coli]